MLPFSLRQNWCDIVDRIIMQENRDPTVNDLKILVENKARAVNHPIFGQITSDKGSSIPTYKEGKIVVVKNLPPKCPACTHYLVKTI